MLRSQANATMSDFLVDTGSPILLSPPSQQLGLQVCTPTPGLKNKVLSGLKDFNVAIIQIRRGDLWQSSSSLVSKKKSFDNY
jgi:hypothetical protein